MNKKILLIADSHITDSTAEAEAFLRLLEKISASEFDIVFLGDIFELWIAYKGYETPIHEQFMRWCLAEKQKRSVMFIEGNHEFYIGRRKRFFTQVSRKSLLLDDGKLYLEHGDTINTHDFLFTLLRLTLRNPLSGLIVGFGGVTGIGRRLSEKIRLGLKGSNMKQKRYYPEHEFAMLEKKMSARGVKKIILGHFHRMDERGMISVLKPWDAAEGVIGVYDTSSRTFRQMKESEIFGS